MKNLKPIHPWRFLDETEREFVQEPKRNVPVASDVDVVLVGGGTSGLFAAIASGRLGAKTVLIDRFGSLGGNLGPGFLVGGGVRVVTGDEPTFPGGLSGIPKEFSVRLRELRNTPEQNYADTSSCVSYLAAVMAQEAGVELVLSAYASDPIVENGTITGLFVEGKSGRVAFKARAVVDATGDADIAMRAGAPIMNQIPDNRAGIYFNIGGVDFARYEEFVSAEGDLSEDDKEWTRQNFSAITSNVWKGKIKAKPFPDALTPALRKASESGEFRVVREIEPGLFIISHKVIKYYDGCGVVSGRAACAEGCVASYDMGQLSRIEAALRIHAFETVGFLRKYAPGFENAYIISMSPFLGNRYGPCIEGEHVLTPEETHSGCEFHDAVLRTMASVNPKSGEGFPGFDTPYRILLPKMIGGLLVTGTGASYIRKGHYPNYRRRPVMMVLGQAAGTAAALAVREGATPKTLDIKILQQQLVDDGIYLGDEERLKELGVRSKCKT